MSIIFKIKTKYSIYKALLLLFLLIPAFSSAASSVTVNNPLGSNDVQTIINNIVNAILGVVGLVAVAMIVYAGVLYTISGGEQKKLDTAKSTLTYAIVGLLVALLSYAIVNFIISAVSGS